MSALRSTHRFWRIIRLWLLGGAGLVALGLLYYFLANIGPKPVGQGSVSVSSPDDPALARLSAEIGELERQYQKAAEAKMVTEEAAAALADAIVKQKELLRGHPNAGLDQSTRLVRLETELDTLRARDKMVLVERLQADGEELLTAGKIDEAGEKLREALKIQKEINLSSAGSRFKNYVRETSLTQAVAAVEAAPLRREMEASLAAARQAAAEQRWADALVAYTAARDAQARINREYGRTRYADLAEADRLTAEIESLNAAGVAAEIDSKEKTGDDAFGRGRFDEAVELFAGAGTLQLQVNQNYPRSRFVSSQRIEKLEIKRQTAASSPLADTLAAHDREISAHLARRQVVAADQKLVQAGPLVEKLFKDFPKSTRLDGALRIKIAYLTLRRPDLRVLQDEVYDRLLPLPGMMERQLLKTEVSQFFYVLVMNTNPSRNPGRTLPVDSVNWTDAQEFCTRLSWMLGVKVRLPTLDEYRVALGGDGGGEFWSVRNSEGRSREVGSLKPNPAGFFDLTGNLAEWVEVDPAADRAPVFGGSYQDSAESLSKLPTVLFNKSDRARNIGFRILVEF